MQLTSIDAEFVACADYATLVNSAATFRNLMGDGAIIRRGEGEKMKEFAVRDFQQEWLREEAERGVSEQRYKGLGEMNPEQLWKPRWIRLLVACSSAYRGCDCCGPDLYYPDG